MIFYLFIIFLGISCDLPVHCEWPSIKGTTWEFSLTDNVYKRDVLYSCQIHEPVPYPIKKSMRLTFLENDVIVDEETKEKGHFTLVYDQGFEITIHGERYFLFFNYDVINTTTVISYCNESLTGWFYNVPKKGEIPEKWGCLTGKKLSSNNLDVFEYKVIESMSPKIPTEEEIKEINENNNNEWTAVKYPDEVYKTISSSFSKCSSPRYNFPSPKPELMVNRKRKNTKSKISGLPEKWDWSDVKGVNYVTPPRNQERCGSCYAFGSTGMFESRARIASKNKWKPIFSPQYLVDCSTFSQGCSGGFPYLMSRWGELEGMVQEICDPYKAVTDNCSNPCPNNRTFIYDVEYIGGYYGASNEENMMEEIVKNGPIAINFEVYNDLRSYKSGVYRHYEDNKKNEKPAPHWEITNHVVVITGYGVTENGTKFWNVKNSWDTTWGDKGFFKIIRGIDNCSIESMTVAAKVIIPEEFEEK